MHMCVYIYIYIYISCHTNGQLDNIAPETTMTATTRTCSSSHPQTSIIDTHINTHRNTTSTTVNN